jgi:hypothetical protein
VRGATPLSIDRVRFLAEAISFDGYPFVGASVHPRGTVSAGHIASVDTRGAPPEVHTVEGETLLVSAVHVRELEAFAKQHGISDVHRRDVWHLILDVYFYPPPDEGRIGFMLEECGFEQAEIDRVRKRVGPYVAPYVAGTWFDWPHLGLYDLLDAHQTCAPRPVSPAELRETYWWAMGIAAKGIAKPPAW